MKLKNIIRIITHSIFVLIITLGIIFSKTAFAGPFAIEKLPDKTVYNDFVVGPGKYQVELKPGESKIVNVVLSNRLGTEKQFSIQIEDFKGSRDLGRPVILLDNERGPYSLKDYLNVASTTFSLGHQERVTIPVKISIPTDAQPGGLYGSVVISTVTTGDEKLPDNGNSIGTSPIVTRIGSLFFIRIAGEIKEDLKLKDFSLKGHSSVLASGPVNFEILYENNGSVHENPYGVINVSNIFGSEVKKLEIEPWFILPDSLRVREIVWDAPFLFGRYTANMEIKKGYGGAIDTATLVFWVIPWKIIVLAFIGIIAIVTIIRWLASKISISVKKK